MWILPTLSKSNTHTKRGHTHMHACIHMKHTPHTAYIYKHAHTVHTHTQTHTHTHTHTTCSLYTHTHTESVKF